MPDLQGTVFIGDFCQNKVWTFRYEDGEVTGLQNRITELQPPGPSFRWPFGGIASQLGAAIIWCQRV